MGCGTSFVKYVLFFFNLVFALAGLAMIGIGVAVKLHVGEITHLLEGNIKVAPLGFIVIGAIIFVIAFFGCCGAVRESHCMIVTYAVMLLVIIIVQVVAAVIVFIYIPDTQNIIGRILNKTFEEALRDEGSPTRKAYSEMEQQLNCCGTTGPRSYKALTLPSSCCPKDINTGAPSTTIFCNQFSAYQEGCVDVLTNYVKFGGRTLAGIAIGVAVIEIVGAIFALCLANSIRNMDRRSRY